MNSEVGCGHNQFQINPDFVVGTSAVEQILKYHLSRAVHLAFLLTSGI